MKGKKNIALLGKNSSYQYGNINTLAPETSITPPLPPLLPSFQHDTITFEKQFQKKKKTKKKQKKHDTRCMCR